jgi:hypothetical protein
VVQHITPTFGAGRRVVRSPLRAFNDFVKAMRRLCLEGLGLGRVGGFHVEEDIEAGSFGVPWSLCFEQGYFRGRVGATNGLRFLLVLRF